MRPETLKDFRAKNATHFDSHLLPLISQADESEVKNYSLIQASGIGTCVKKDTYIMPGVTHESGISTASIPSKSASYNPVDGTLYIIDISKIGNKNTAFSMEGTLISNGATTDQADGVGNEVNITQVPPEAIVGWTSASMCSWTEQLLKTVGTPKEIQDNYISINPLYKESTSYYF